MAEISDERYEELRLILEKKYEQVFALEEAKEIGDGLVDFFKLLAKFENEDEDLKFSA